MTINLDFWLLGIFATTVKKIISLKYAIIGFIFLVWSLFYNVKILYLLHRTDSVDIVGNMLEFVPGKVEFQNIADQCQVGSAHLLLGVLQKQIPFVKKNIQDICLPYDIFCKLLNKAVIPQEEKYPYQFAMFLTANQNSYSDNYKKTFGSISRIVKLTKNEEHNNCNTFFENFIEWQKNNKNEFKYFDKYNLGKECYQFRDMLFGFQATEDQRKVSIILIPSPVLHETKDNTDTFIIVAFVNQEEVKNVKCSNENIDYIINRFQDIALRFNLNKFGY